MGISAAVEQSREAQAIAVTVLPAPPRWDTWIRHLCRLDECGSTHPPVGSRHRTQRPRPTCSGTSTTARRSSSVPPSQAACFFCFFVSRSSGIGFSLGSAQIDLFSQVQAWWRLHLHREPTTAHHKSAVLYHVNRYSGPDYQHSFGRYFERLPAATAPATSEWTHATRPARGGADIYGAECT